MSVSVKVVFYSPSGHTYELAKASAGPCGDRSPTANELAIARFQGKRTAELAVCYCRA